MGKEEYKNYLDNIRNHLDVALALAEKFQTQVQTDEGDSELFRKLSCYLRPNLHHWIHGPQAGNIKDIDELLKSK